MSTPTLIPTPSQTVGPFFRTGMTWPGGGRLFDDADITIEGVVFDALGAPVSDAVIELWQLRRGQQYTQGFGRVQTNAQGDFKFHTVKPEPLPGHKPFIHVSVFARGLLQHQTTRLFLQGVGQLTTDAMLDAAGERGRTLIAKVREPNVFAWKIRLGGPRETLFLDL
jgi:protocatechuate 3,4-dioxygenase, alpha subunit